MKIPQMTDELIMILDSGFKIKTCPIKNFLVYRFLSDDLIKGKFKI